MAWNTPSTWTAGAVLAAAQLNAQVRDNMKAIGDPWTAYTPQWIGATTNPVIGNGSITGAYMQAGKFVNFRIRIVMGTTTTYGAGAYTFGLPVPAIVGIDNAVDCNVFLKDVSAGTRALRTAYFNTASLIAPCDAAGVLINSAAPWAWASTDIISITGTYEAA